ncbi:hypothetical cytosolic protein [Syntrophus aciditrophicus SB]|uniref:Hypothetical cytosolic protein n=2 Tax=Syntrophus TaxID=43773 RepID=Q2LW48_SYNAS|nr:hypothetical cytosolic protein [Syntrophus aciditrophicus SB]
MNMNYNYKDYLKTLIGKKGTLDMPRMGCSYYVLCYNKSDVQIGNAQVTDVQDDFVVVHHDVHGTVKIPMSHCL